MLIGITGGSSFILEFGKDGKRNGMTVGTFSVLVTVLDDSVPFGTSFFMMLPIGGFKSLIGGRTHNGFCPVDVHGAELIGGGGLPDVSTILSLRRGGSLTSLSVSFLFSTFPVGFEDDFACAWSAAAQRRNVMGASSSESESCVLVGLSGRNMIRLSGSIAGPFGPVGRNGSGSTLTFAKLTRSPRVSFGAAQADDCCWLGSPSR